MALVVADRVKETTTSTGTGTITLAGAVSGFQSFSVVGDGNTADKILNLPAILAYREALRLIALNPPITVNQWPIKPKTEWNTI